MKQGMLLSQFAIWILVVVGLVLATIIYFVGPSSFYQSVTRMIPGVDEFIPSGDNTIPSDYSRQQQEESTVIYNSLVIAYERLATSGSDACFTFLDYQAFEALYEHHYIELVPTIEGGTQISLIRKLEDNRGDVISEVFSYDIAGVKPCVIYGEGQVRQFYNDWLKEGAEGAPSPDEITAPTRIQLKDSKIYLGDDLREQFLIDPQKSMPFGLYKNGNHICMFPVRIIDLRGDCTYMDGMITNGCAEWDGYLPVALATWDQERQCGGITP